MCARSVIWCPWASPNKVSATENLHWGRRPIKSHAWFKRVRARRQPNGGQFESLPGSAILGGMLLAHNPAGCCPDCSRHCSDDGQPSSGASPLSSTRCVTVRCFADNSSCYRHPSAGRWRAVFRCSRGCQSYDMSTGRYSLQCCSSSTYERYRLFQLHQHTYSTSVYLSKFWCISRKLYLSRGRLPHRSYIGPKLYRRAAADPGKVLNQSILAYGSWAVATARVELCAHSSQVAACVNAVREDPDGFACQYPCDYSQWRDEVIAPSRGALISAGTEGADKLDQ